MFAQPRRAVVFRTWSALRAPVLTVAALLTAAAPLAAQFTPVEAELARFDAEVAAEVAEDATGAVSVAVFRGREVLWEKGWGWADIENRVQADARTIGRTGSISKTFTAALMMRLVDQEIIGLDDPVADHLPEIERLADPPAGAEPITFRMLASHTAGLDREPELDDAASGVIYRWGEKILQSIPRTGFRTPPGTEYAYSNIGVGMLGLALSRAAGAPFMELMETLVFRPLGLESTTFVVDAPDMLVRMSVGYSRDRETGSVSARRATLEHRGRGYKVPNGGVYSTVGDLAAFAAALMGEDPVAFLSEESQRRMLTPQAPAEEYGLGLQLFEVDGQAVAGHGGSVAGYNARLVFDPQTKLGVAMLRTTSYDPPVTELLGELVRSAAPDAAANGESRNPSS